MANRAFKRNKVDRDNVVWNTFDQLQQKLKTEWTEIKSKSRVEIHYSGFAGTEIYKLGIEKNNSRCGSQIGRIFRAMQDKVEVIYITTNEIPEEVQRYFYKIMELADLKLGTRKVHFLSLQSDYRSSMFPDHFSTPAKILYSKPTLNRIKKVDIC